MRFSKTQAFDFLYFLGNGSKKFTFVVIPESGVGGGSVKEIYGTLDKLWPVFVSRNKEGCGIFVTVQKTDGRGRKKENIVGVRAIFQEDDGNGVDLPVEPNIIVRTSGGHFHRYFLVDGCPNGGEWERVQGRLVQDWGSDRGAKDLSRVLRLPGLYNRKGGRWESVRLEKCGGERYKWSELVEYFPPLPPVGKKIRRKKNKGVLLEPAKIYSALRYLDPDMNYEDWILVLMAIHSEGGGEEGEKMAREWSMEGEKWNEREFEKRWVGFRLGGGISIGTLYDMSRGLGWEGEYELDEVGKEWLELEKSRSTSIRIVEREELRGVDDRGLPDGLVKLIYKWSSRKSYVRQPVFDLGTAFLSMALLSGNRYQIKGWRTPLQPYMIFMIRSGGGKDHMIRCIGELLAEVGFDRVLASGFQSYHSMFDQLSEPPHMLCWLLDEIAEHLKNGMKPGTQDRSIIRHLLSMYGLGNGRFHGLFGRTQNIDPIDRPFVLIGATAQTEVLAEVVSQDYINNGFISRFLLFNGGEGELKRNRDRINLDVGGLGFDLSRFSMVDIGTDVEFADGLGGVVDDFADFCLGQEARGGEWVVWNRVNQNALILAGLLAVGQDPLRPVIDREIWEYSSNLSMESVKSWMTVIEMGGVSGNMTGEEEKAKIRIMKVLADKTVARKYAQNPAELKKLNEGWVTRSILMRSMGAGIRKRGFVDALDWLLDSKSIAVGRMGKSTCYRIN